MNDDLFSNLERCMKQHITNVVYHDRNKTPSTEDYKVAIQDVEEFLTNTEAVENLVNTVRNSFTLP